MLVLNQVVVQEEDDGDILRRNKKESEDYPFWGEYI
jgi:hypothetical protein